LKETNFLYELDRVTKDVLKTISSEQSSGNASIGDLIAVPHTNHAVNLLLSFHSCSFLIAVHLGDAFSCTWNARIEENSDSICEDLQGKSTKQTNRRVNCFQLCGLH
jgi:hypothetical protein